MGKRQQSGIPSEKRRIIRRILKLHAGGEPINITAVKRSRPNLIAKAYEIKPFWGWKQALEDAGIDYADIRVHLMDHVTCHICNESFRCLGTHIHRIHGCDADEYRIDYPEADLLCEELRANLMRIGASRPSKSPRLALPHWEPLWTPEYVLDRTAELYRRNIPVNHEHLSKAEPIVSHGIQFFGSWDNVLVRVGLDPEEIRLSSSPRRLDAKGVIKGILQRQRAGLPLAAMALTSGPYTDFSLHRQAREHFGSWRGAKRAAGLDKTTSYGRVLRFPTPESVCKEIRRRRKEGLPLEFKAMHKAPLGDRRLINIARTVFGSWSKAVTAAGLDYSTITQRKRNPYQTKAAVVRALKDRHSKGMPLTTNGVRKGKHRDVPLMEASLKLFGKWSLAKKAAGVPPYDSKG